MPPPWGGRYASCGRANPLSLGDRRALARESPENVDETSSFWPPNRMTWTWQRGGLRATTNGLGVTSPVWSRPQFFARVDFAGPAFSGEPTIRSFRPTTL